MKKSLQYLGSILLTLLLIFSMLGTVGVMLVRHRALNPTTCKQLIESENLPTQVHDSLHAYYVQQENTTGIPVSAYENILAEDCLREMMETSVQRGFAYLNGETDTVKAQLDFAVLESDLTAFFNKYAEENNCEKDAVFDETLAKAISTAESNIQVSTDIFRFASLEDAGVLKKAKRVMPYLPKLEIACIAADVLLMILLVILHRKKLRDVVYWIASAVFCASNLMLVPALWVEKTQWFDRFAVKSAQIFAAVTGYLYGLTGAVITVGICGLVLAILLWGLRLIGKKQQSV